MRKENCWEIRSDILKMMELIMKAICLSFFLAFDLFSLAFCHHPLRSASTINKSSPVQLEWNAHILFSVFFLLLLCQAARSIWVHSHRNYMSKHYAKHIEINSHFTLEIKYVARVEEIHVIAPVLLALVGSVLISKISNSFSPATATNSRPHTTTKSN